jgi:hypothetical protein
MCNLHTQKHNKIHSIQITKLKTDLWSYGKQIIKNVSRTEWYVNNVHKTNPISVGAVGDTTVQFDDVDPGDKIKDSLIK